MVWLQRRLLWRQPQPSLSQVRMSETARAGAAAHLVVVHRGAVKVSVAQFQGLLNDRRILHLVGAETWQQQQQQQRRKAGGESPTASHAR